MWKVREGPAATHDIEGKKQQGYRVLYVQSQIALL